MSGLSWPEERGIRGVGKEDPTRLWKYIPEPSPIEMKVGSNKSCEAQSPEAAYGPPAGLPFDQFYALPFPPTEIEIVIVSRLTLISRK